MTEDAKHTPGPYRVGTLRMNDGALPILAPADPETYGSDQRRIALVDPSIDVKRGAGWNLTEEDDPEQMATARLFAAAVELVPSLQCMTALVLLKYGNLDPDVNVAVAAAQAALGKALGAPA